MPVLVYRLQIMVEPSITTYLKLPCELNASRLKEDAVKFGSDEWTPHFNAHYYEGDWSGISLRAAADAHVQLYPDPTASEFCDTPAMSRCTYVPEVLSGFDCELETVRFLRLGPGARIREHRDYKLGIEDGVARVHVPVVTNEKIRFFLNGELVPMKEGEAWYLNFNLRHSVENNSDLPRVHLVIDLKVNEWFLSLAGLR
jgi:Aspartyl/Asparaginyl beta-hydroxylase